MKISILGSGNVGQATGKVLSVDNEVVFYDIDENKLSKLKSEGYDTTNNLDNAINGSDVSFIAVPTPTEGGKIDLRFIEDVTKDCGISLKRKNGFHIFVIKSTIIPGTTEKIIIPRIEMYSNKKVNEDFGVVFNPEFLTEVSKTWTTDKSFEREFGKEDRIVIGEANDKKTGDIIEELFKSFNTKIFRTDYKTAEMIKYVSNVCLASRISFFNELWFVCNEIGLDSNVIAKIVGMDKRIGRYGTIHGKAFGGKCLPKDLEAFIGFIEENCSYNPELLKAVQNINNKIREIKGVRE